MKTKINTKSIDKQIAKKREQSRQTTLTIRLTTELLTQFRKACEEKDYTMTEVLIALMEDYSQRDS